MDRQKFIELMKRLKQSLILRDNSDYDPLFCRDTVRQLDDCISKLRYAEHMGYDDVYFCNVINFDLKNILQTAAESQKSGKIRGGINDDPDSLRPVREALIEIANVGIAGHFRDPTYALPVLINTITTWIHLKERALEDIYLLPLPAQATD